MYVSACGGAGLSVCGAVVCLGEVVNGLHQQGDLLVSLGGEVVDEMDHSGGRGS